MGVTTKVVASFKERQVCMTLECMCRSQTCDARTDDCDAKAVCVAVATQKRPPEYKNAAKRPGANEGGREEEENRPGVATEPEFGRLRSNETVLPPATFDRAADDIKTMHISA